MQQHHAVVVDRDWFRQRPDLTRHRVDLAHHPDGEIRDVHSEIEHCAAARLLGRDEPALPGRPAFGTAVRQARADEMRDSDRAADDRLFYDALEAAVAALHRDHQHTIRLCCRGNHPARLGRSRRHRLFHQHVSACA